MARSSGEWFLLCIMPLPSLIFHCFRKAGLWKIFCLVQYLLFFLLLEEDSIQPFFRCILYFGRVNFLRFQMHSKNRIWSNLFVFWCRSRLWLIQIPSLFHRFKIVLQRPNYYRKWKHFPIKIAVSHLFILFIFLASMQEC